MANPAVTAVFFMCVAALGAYSFVQDSAATKALAAKHRLTPEQTAAFKACHSQMSGKSLESHSTKGTIKDGRVPDDICICQSKLMAETFKPYTYADHRLVIDYKVKGSGPHSLSPSNLKPGIDGEVQFTLLADQLSACAAEYRLNEAAAISKLQAEQKRLDQH